MSRYADRKDAGRQLAERLAKYARHPNAVVLALPRGGLPVGYEVAKALGLPLDVFLVRKLGAPMQPELAMGAIASGGARVLNPQVIGGMGITEEEIARIEQEERRELQRRERAYRGDRPWPDMAARTALLTDDGLATGASMRAAVQALRAQGAQRIVVAVPTAPADTAEGFREIADEMVCPYTPSPFYAVGNSYRDFRQTTDEEVADYMRKAQEELPQP